MDGRTKEGKKHDDEQAGNENKTESKICNNEWDRHGQNDWNEPMHAALTWIAVAVAAAAPLHIHRLHRRRFRRNRRASVSLSSSRATSFPGTRIRGSASHTAYTARAIMISARNSKNKEINSLASIAQIVTGQGAALYLPPATKETSQLSPQHGALASR